MDDQDIVTLYFLRSEQAITETAQKYGGYCYSIAYGILGDARDAEESVNDTYTDTWNQIPPHRPTVLSCFLGKITRRIAIDRYRRNHAEKRGGGELPLVLEELDECIAGEHTVESAVEGKVLENIVRVFVRKLPETEKKVFLCRYWYMEPIRQIGLRFGFSESKVKTILYKTRKKLYDNLKKEGFL